MRSKNILSTAAFIVAFVFSTAFASLFIAKSVAEPEFISVNTHQSTSCFKKRGNSATAVKISLLVSEDKRNGRESNRRVYEMGGDVISPFAGSTFSAYADSVEQYVDASSSIEAGDLPGDFQTAWREHMKAWRDHSTFLSKMKNASNRKGWSQAEFEDTENFHNREISRTWYEVIYLGRTYGADVSY